MTNLLWPEATQGGSTPITLLLFWFLTSAFQKTSLQLIDSCLSWANL